MEPAVCSATQFETLLNTAAVAVLVLCATVVVLSICLLIVVLFIAGTGGVYLLRQRVAKQSVGSLAEPSNTLNKRESTIPSGKPPSTAEPLRQGTSLGDFGDLGDLATTSFYRKAEEKLRRSQSTPKDGNSRCQSEKPSLRKIEEHSDRRASNSSDIARFGQPDSVALALQKIQDVRAFSNDSVLANSVQLSGGRGQREKQHENENHEERSSLWDIPPEMLPSTHTQRKVMARGLEVTSTEGFIESLSLAEKVGGGAFGQVYLCNWEGVQAAVKLIELSVDPKMKKSSVQVFLQEAEVAALLRHPNIVQVYKVNIEGIPGKDFPSGAKGYAGSIVMEYCEMGSLADAIKDKLFTFGNPDSPELVDLQLMLKVAEDVARGMLFLHNQGVLHADLKPNNVLLKQGPDGVVAKLTDFGLSVQMSKSQTHVSQHQTGTLDHMAPEVMMEGKSSKRSDVYSFGILMWELFSSSRPYSGLRDVAIVHRVVEEDLRPVFPSSAPREYVELAVSCWAKDPQKRPPFSEVLAKVEQMSVIIARVIHGQAKDMEQGKHRPLFPSMEAAVDYSKGNPDPFEDEMFGISGL